MTAGVTAAGGFSANGISAGIKPNDALDLALLAAPRPVPMAAVFTQTRTPAAAVQVSSRRMASGFARAIVVNSGCANAATGAAGIHDAEAMTAAVAGELGCSAEYVLVCSTGTIGDRLPIDSILKATSWLVGGLGDTDDHGLAAAQAIMTSDSVPKQATWSGHGYTIGGMSKGAGMVRPSMATMLALITTDAIVDSEPLQRMLREAVDVSFNCLNIDGCQSTNDAVIVMASGESGVTPDAAEFAGGLETLCRDLAEQMARDAEGASRVVHLEVTGASTDSDARRFGMVVADSALVRSSFYGADPNWGRIYGALGVAGIDLDPNEIEIAYDGTVIASRGVAIPVDEEALSARMNGDFTVTIRVGAGPGRASVVTTDLTPDYVRFNGERS